MNDYSLSYEWLSGLVGTYGLIGIFIVSALGNMIPYTTIPYLLLVMAYTATLPSDELKIATAIVSAIGAAVGKVVVYYIGKGASKIISDNTRRKLKNFARIIEKGLFITIFLFAALPLPDDVIYIPVGMSGYSIVRFFVAVALGKIVITIAAVYFGSTIKWFLEGGLGLPLWLSIPILVIVTLWLTYVIVKMDWEGIVETYSNDGFIKGTIRLLMEFFKALVYPFITLYKRMRR